MLILNYFLVLRDVKFYYIFVNVVRSWDDTHLSLEGEACQPSMLTLKLRGVSMIEERVEGVSIFQLSNLYATLKIEFLKFDKNHKGKCTFCNF